MQSASHETWVRSFTGSIPDDQEPGPVYGGLGVRHLTNTRARGHTHVYQRTNMARFTVQSMLRQAYKYRSMGSSGYLIARPSNFRGNTIPSAGCSHVFLSLRSRSLKQIRVLRWPDRALLLRLRRRINASINSASPAILPANVT